MHAGVRAGGVAAGRRRWRGCGALKAHLIRQEFIQAEEPRSTAVMYEQQKQLGYAEMDESRTVYASDIKGGKKIPPTDPLRLPQLPCISKECTDFVFLCPVSTSIDFV